MQLEEIAVLLYRFVVVVVVFTALVLFARDGLSEQELAVLEDVAELNNVSLKYK